MSTTKAALRNLNEGLSKVEGHVAALVGDIEKLRESSHANANALARVEGTLAELKDNSDADGRAIGQLQNVVGTLSDRQGQLTAKVEEMLQRMDRILVAASIRPEPPTSVGFASPEETTNPGLRHGER